MVLKIKGMILNNGSTQGSNPVFLWGFTNGCARKTKFLLSVLIIWVTRGILQKIRGKLGWVMHVCNPSSQDSEAERVEAQENPAYITGSRKKIQPHHWHYFINNLSNSFKTTMLKEVFNWLEIWLKWFKHGIAYVVYFS